MMISDILSDAQDSVRDWLKGDTYNCPKTRMAIKNTLRVMRMMQHVLDAPPGCGDPELVELMANFHFTAAYKKVEKSILEEEAELSNMRVRED